MMDMKFCRLASNDRRGLIFESYIHIREMLYVLSESSPRVFMPAYIHTYIHTGKINA
jgi:hypothetical protein